MQLDRHKEVIVENPLGITSADIIVGIPSYNEADNIAFPTDVVSRGLVEFFPRKKSVIVNIDNHSPDGTKDAFWRTPTKIPKIYVSTPPGVKGKGQNIGNLFDVAMKLRAKAILIISADLKSISPSWIQYLCEPLMRRFDFVTPIYVRHKNDATITNHIAYPMLQALFGLRVRQPLGGDFGVSGKLARAFLSEKIWNENIMNYGIDLWMTTLAITRNFNICQAFLGTPKIHRPEDPASDLYMMFKQVVGTLFDLMIEFQYMWMDTFDSIPSSIYGFGLGVVEKPPEINLNAKKLHKYFLQVFDEYEDTWQQIIPQEEYPQIHSLNAIKDTTKFILASHLWARILFNFAVAYKNRLFSPEQILEALIPFYFARILSFSNETGNYETRESEEYLADTNIIFEQEKQYLIRRWNE